MNAIIASTESYVDRNHRLRRLLQEGLIADSEWRLILLLVTNLPNVLTGTPYVYDVGWNDGRFDLLLTDGLGTWCAVELKQMTAIRGSSSARRNRRRKRNEKWHLLIAQMNRAYRAAADRCPEGRVQAYALLHDEGVWTVADSIGADDRGPAEVAPNLP